MFDLFIFVEYEPKEVLLLLFLLVGQKKKQHTDPTSGLKRLGDKLVSVILSVTSSSCLVRPFSAF